ncbi:response regulator transcription factor [Actinophytocola sp.]|uniref:response regulator transcription factor n=1 Tax=Actinophytocola sp. TaxID=1872138 RepID=UPI002ECFD9DF
MTRAASGSQQHVLVVDDDPQVRTVVSWQLAAEGFAVAEAGDGESALRMIDTSSPDLVVLDLGLPKLGGLDVLTRVRKVSAVPVILLTGRAGEMDRIVGLDLGADDYLVKPFSPGELAARARSVLRRIGRNGQDGPLTFGRLTIEAATREVTVDGVRVELTAREFDLLHFLALSPRQVFSREQLLEQVWDSSAAWQVAATVTQHVHRLRGKLGIRPGEPGWVSTVRGAGYRLSP